MPLPARRAYDACGQEAGVTADDESGQGLVTDGSHGVYRLGGFGEVPPVDTVGHCFDVTAQGFGCCLLFDFPEYFPEAGHAAVAAKVHNGLPREVADVRKDDRDRVPLQIPSLLIVEPLSDDLGMEPVGSYGESCRSGQYEITVGAVDDGLAGELDRDRVLQGAVALISPGLPLRELLHLASRITGRHELHPVGALRQLVSEGMQRRCPRDGCLGRHHGAGRRFRSSVRTDRNRKGRSGSRPPFCWGLPARRVIVGRWHDEARRSMWASVNPEYAGL